MLSGASWPDVHLALVSQWLVSRLMVPQSTLCRPGYCSAPKRPPGRAEAVLRSLVIAVKVSTVCSWRWLETIVCFFYLRRVHLHGALTYWQDLKRCSWHENYWPAFGLDLIAGIGQECP